MNEKKDVEKHKTFLAGGHHITHATEGTGAKPYTRHSLSAFAVVFVDHKLEEVEEREGGGGQTAGTSGLQNQWSISPKQSAILFTILFILFLLLATHSLLPPKSVPKRCRDPSNSALIHGP